MLARSGALITLIGVVVWATSLYYVKLGQPDEAAGEMNNLYRAWRIAGNVGALIGKTMTIVGTVVLGVGALVEIL